jgi:hypothetical protein
MSDTSEIYRQRAEACRDQAARATDPHHKRQYLEMADGWLKLARHAEQWERKLKGEE